MSVQKRRLQAQNKKLRNVKDQIHFFEYKCLLYKSFILP
jgi:hypothetical protein